MTNSPSTGAARSRRRKQRRLLLASTVLLVVGGGAAAIAYRTLGSSTAERATYHFNMGGISLRDGDPQAAEVHLLRSLEFDAGRADARYLLAESLFEQGRSAEAVVELERAVAATPHHGPSNIRLARLAAQSGDLQTAVTRARAALRAPEVPSGAASLLARAQIALGDLDGACAALDDVLTWNESPQVALAAAQASQLADLLTWSDERKDRTAETMARAIQRAEAVLEREPDDAQARLALAAGRLAQGDLRGARAALPPPPATGPLPESALLLRAWLIEAEGDPERAAEMLDVRLGYAATSGVRSALARIHLRQGRGREALAVLRSSQQEASWASAWARLLAATAAWSAAEHGLLPEVLRRPVPPGNRFGGSTATLALAADTSSAGRRARLGALGPHALAAIAAGSAEAPYVAHFERQLAALLADTPNDAFGLTWAAAVLLARGDSAGATERASSARAADPSLPEACWVLGLSQADLDRHDDAVTTLDEARVLGAPTPAREAAFGLVLLGAGRREQAVRHLSEAQLRCPGDVLVAAALAAVAPTADEMSAPTPQSADAAAILERIDREIAAGDTNALKRATGLLERARVAGAPARSVALSRGRLLLARGQNRPARKLAMSLVESDPSDPAARDLLIAAVEALGDRGARYALAGEWLAAARAYDARAQAAPEDAEAARRAVSAYRKAGALEEAERAVRRGLEHHPDGIGLQIQFARVLAARGSTAEAETILRNIVAERPEAMRAASALADVLRRSGRPGEGAAVLRSVIEGEGDVENRLDAALQLLAAGAPSAEDRRAVEALVASAAHDEVHRAEVELLRGHLALAERRDADALGIARRLVEIEPAWADGSVLLAASLARAGRMEAAAKRALTALERDASHLAARRLAGETCLLAGRAAERAGNTDAAVRWYTSALLDAPTDRFARAALCRLLIGAGGDASAAARKLRAQVDERLPGSPTGALLVAQCLALGGKQPEAASAYLSVLATRPANPEALGALAQLERTLEEADDVRAAVDAAVQNGQTRALAWALRGAAADQADALEEAERYYRFALDDAPRDPNVHAHLVDVLVRAGKTDEARALAASAPVGAGRSRGGLGGAQLLLAAGDDEGALDLLAPLAGTDGVAAYTAARMCARADDLPGAEKHARTAVELAPRSPAASLLLVTVLGRAGKLAAAETYFAQAADSDPENPVPACMCGVVALRKGEHETGVTHLKRAVELAPGYALAANNLAWVLGVELGRVDEALPYARSARAAFPADAEAADTLGWLLHLAGKDAEALPHLESAVARKPRSAPIRLRQADCLAAAGRDADAIIAYEKVAELDPAFAAREKVAERISKLR